MSAAVALIATATSTTAHAGEPETRRAEALFREGRDAQARGDNETACAKFAESLTLAPGSVGPTLNLAQCDEQRGDLVEALRRWQAGIFLLSGDDPRLAALKTRVEALSKRVPRLLVKRGNGVPADAKITIDGAEIDRAADASPHLLNPGTHLVAITRDDHLEWSTKVTLAEGEQREVLAIPPVAPAPAERPASPAPAARSSGARTLGFVLGGVGAASLAAGGVTGLLTLSKKSVMQENCRGGCNDAARDAARAGKTLSTVSTITFIAGAASAGAGVILFLMSKPKSSTATTATFATVLPGGAGLSMVREF